MNKRTRDKARERRTEKRITDVAIGRKKASDAFIEEAVDEAVDWVERGGLQRTWVILKVIAGVLALTIAALILYVVDNVL